jgi:hypothetical protein
MELCLTGPALVGALRAIISDTPVEETGKE